MTAAPITRLRRSNGRELFVAAIVLAGEGARSWIRRENKRTRERLRRALCMTAERLSALDGDVEPMVGEVRCGHHRGLFIREHPR